MSSKSVSVVCINDFHAELFESEHAPGCAKLSTLISRYKLEHPHTIVVFGGDNYKGDPVSEQLSGEPVTYLMRHLGVQASAVGNHEFDFGLKQINRWSKEGGYPYVAANVLDKRTGDLPEGLVPYKIVEVGGVMIAFLGLCTVEDLDRDEYPEDIRQLVIVDGAQEAKRWVAYLNSGRDPLGRPDVILALTHYGLKRATEPEAWIGEEVHELCRQVPELSGVNTAHWHQFVSGHIGEIPVVQGSSSGKGFAAFTIELSVHNEIVRVTPEYVDYSTVGPIPPDEQVQRQMEVYHRLAMQELGIVVGRIEQELVHKSPMTAEVDMEGTPFTKLTLDVMRQETGCAIALMYSGRLGLGLPRGDITLYLLRKLLMFDDEIITMKLLGSDLLRNIENGISTLRGERASPIAVSGLQVEADYRKPYRSRILSITLGDGRPLESERYYEVAMDAYIASNEMGYDVSAAVDRKPTGVFLREAIIRTIRARGGLSDERSGCMKVAHKPVSTKENGPSDE